MKHIADVELQTRLSQVKLLALDVDGVLTDGGLYYTDSGEESKRFNVKDGMGIKLVMAAGLEVAIITNSTSKSVLHRAEKLGITHVFMGIEDKLAVLKELCIELSIDLEQVAYVGDDINDLSVLKAVGCPLTVADAIPVNQTVAIYITECIGGNGAVREICDLLLSI
ncbi:MAG TPA: HAD-IIIA family hydrolase [Coleofasciculaceae cyanobacterium]|jgi:3-deoxy-D-manno-octulosonate 8-phosphate phosphatase (KDO 8-P phosphatase)